MRQRRNYNNSASAGISAMIIFVALVLVSAVVSITIVSFGQQIFKSTQDDAEKTENVIYGKIIVSSVIITAIEFDNNDEPNYAVLQVTMELSPGAPTVEDDLVKWAVFCENGADDRFTRWSNEGDLESATKTTDSGSDPGAVDTLEVGTNYMITLKLYHTTDTDDPPDNVMDEGGCPPAYFETHTLIFVMGDSGSYSSWDLRYDESLKEGDQII